MTILICIFFLFSALLFPASLEAYDQIGFGPLLCVLRCSAALFTWMLLPSLAGTQ